MIYERQDGRTCCVPNGGNGDGDPRSGWMANVCATEANAFLASLNRLFESMKGTD
jgi:hypothetical protein